MAKTRNKAKAFQTNQKDFKLFLRFPYVFSQLNFEIVW